MTCEDVHCGVWVNWSNGRLRGSTLTLPKESGSILIAFLALFVGIVGSHLWSMLCFIIHQYRATPRKHNDLFYQLQALLRSSTSPVMTVWNILIIIGSRRSWRMFLRCLPLLLLSASYMVLLAAAGLLSPKFFLASDEVLVKSDKCGWVAEVDYNDSLSNTTSVDVANALLIAGRYSYDQSLKYSQSCYQNQEGEASCDSFVKPQIPSTVNYSAECPFQKDICATPAISMDSGLIESGKDLGINSNSGDRIAFRKTMTCAPLLGEKFSLGWFPVPGALLSGDAMKVWNFGPTLFNSSVILNYTFSNSNYSNFYATEPYLLYFAQNLDANLPDSTVDPTKELRVNGSDLFIVGLRNAVSYIGRVDDPWFNATTMRTDLTPPTWIASNYLTFLGCNVQYQMCTRLGCSQPSGLSAISYTKEDNPDLSENELAVVQLVWKAIWGTQLHFSNLILRSALLLANNYIWAALNSATLPSNQWQNEMLNWHNVSLALLQRRIVEFASPVQVQVRPGVTSLNYVHPPQTSGLQDLCNGVRARKSGYSQFNMLGLMLTLVIGFVILVTQWSLPFIVGKYQHRNGKVAERKTEWDEMGVLQLLRRALEGWGVGPWRERIGVPMVVDAEQEFSFTGLINEAQSVTLSSPEIKTRQEGVTLLSGWESPTQHLSGVEAFKNPKS